MQVFRSTAIVAPFPRRSVSARTLRMWCTPEVILALTDLTDEATLLPHIINHARQGNARIILAHIQDAPTPGVREIRETLDLLARRLRWLGFTCEPVMLSGRPEREIPFLARSCGVDRVLFEFKEEADPTKRQYPPLPEQLLRALDVPVCAIGRNAVHSIRTTIRNVTLAISSESRCEIPLSFACRLAQEFRAKLNVLHVAEEGSSDTATRDCVLARLPFSTWREAELFCPSEIVVREGQPVDGILDYCATTQQDLIILCSSGSNRSAESWRKGVSYRTIAGARCPVFIAGDNSGRAVDVLEMTVSEEFSPRGEELTEEEERRKSHRGAGV